MARACKLVEVSFDPSGGAEISLPDQPSVPSLIAKAPRGEDFDLTAVSGVSDFKTAVDHFAGKVESFENEVDDLDGEIERFIEKCERAAENAEPSRAFRPFSTHETTERQMEMAGFNRCDEVVILLRGDYDRLVFDSVFAASRVYQIPDARKDCACKFDSTGKCIHRGCGLTAADWAEVEVA